MCGGRLVGQDGVEWTRATASLDHVPGLKVLNRQTKGVKFNRNEIIDSELTNKRQIFKYIQNNKKIIKSKILSERERFV
jgi:hypothetical protein